MSFLLILFILFIGLVVIFGGRRRPVEYRMMMVEPIEPDGIGCGPVLLVGLALLVLWALTQ